MTTLKDGRFVFIHAERQHLLLEQPSTINVSTGAKGTATVQPPPLPTQLLYGGVVYAFALNAAQTRIAMLCPASSAAAVPAAPPSAAPPKLAEAVLRLFSFTNNEVGELLGELVTVMAQRIVWVGDRIIALDVQHNAETTNDDSLSDAPPAGKSKMSKSSSSVILVEVTKSPLKLKLLREDKTASAPVAGPGSILCDVCTSKQSISLWDMQRNKMISECQLPNRRCRHGKARVAATTSSDGSFVFVANDDWTVHGFYVARNGIVHTPKPMLTQFESQLVYRAAQGNITANSRKYVDDEKQLQEGESPDHKVEYNVEKNDTTKADSVVQPSRASASRAFTLPAPRLHVRCLSETQVLLALTGSPTILQCAYDSKGKNEELTVVAKMRLPRRLQATAEVIGLSRTRYLVRQRSSIVEDAEGDAATTQNTSTYAVLPLDLKPAGNVSSTPAEESREAIASATANMNQGGADDAAGEEGASTAEATAMSDRKRKKKKNKKGGDAVTADAAADVSAITTEPAVGTTTSTDSASTPAEGRAGTGRLTQRAVERLLVHAGISGKDRLHNAFTRERGNGNAGDSKKTVPTASNAGESNAPLRKEGLVTNDVLITASGVVLGVAVGIFVMHKLSLL